MIDDTSRSSKILTPVYYRSSQLQFPKSAILELTAEDQVRITVTNQDTPSEVVVYAPLSQVQRLLVFRGSLMRLRINDQLHLVDVDTRALKQAHDSRYRSAKDWIELLKQHGIPARSINPLLLSLVPAAIIAVLQIAVLIVHLLTAK